MPEKNGKGEFELDLVLRNNRASKDHPLGIFHPHEELHHIKKENIGLIEVMGLAILPGRLNAELKQIEKIMTGNILDKPYIEENDMLYKHRKWIEELIAKYGTHLEPEMAREILRQEVGNKFLNVLLDAGVYKRNEDGRKAFVRFMTSLGFKEI